MMAMADYHHRCTRKIRLGLYGTAIVQVTVKYRFLPLIKMLPHRRMDAVRPNQDVTTGLSRRFAVWVGETRENFITTSIEAGKAMACDNGLRAEAVMDRSEQDFVAIRRAKLKSEATCIRQRGRAVQSRSTDRACCRRRAPA